MNIRAYKKGFSAAEKVRIHRNKRIMKKGRAVFDSISPSRTGTNYNFAVLTEEDIPPIMRVLQSLRPIDGESISVTLPKATDGLEIIQAYRQTAGGYHVEVLVKTNKEGSIDGHSIYARENVDQSTAENLFLTACKLQKLSNLPMSTFHDITSAARKECIDTGKRIMPLHRR